MSAYNELTDNELVSLLTAGDNIAYTEIYNRYHGKLYIHVFQKLGSREDSKDVIHDLFISLWHNHSKLELKTTLAAYLYTAARYRVFDRISRKQVETKYIKSIELFASQGEYITDHEVRERELVALIDKEIAALPPKMREIFNLSRKENLTHKEIAVKLNLSSQTVKTQVNNALRVLRVKLGAFVVLCFFM